MNDFLPFWIGLGVSAVLSWPLLLVMRKVKAHAAISQYTPEHAGKAGTPSMGGIAPLIALISVVAFVYTSELPIKLRDYRLLNGILAALIGFGLLGFIDDFLIPRLMPGKRGLGWTIKLVMQVALAIAIAWLIVPEDEVKVLILAFVIIFFANAVNFSDGLDGLCGGLLILASLAFLGGHLAFMVLALIGALIPFLLLNAPPAKIFMGDVGALPFGALYGILVASHYLFGSGGSASVIWIVLVASLIFILEIGLVPLQLLWVKTFKRRLIPASPVHHSFEKLGWPETRITATFILIQAVLTILAISLHGWELF